MTDIDIAICTFRRPHLAATLCSLAALDRPAGTSLRLIVADNDDTPTAQALVKESVSETGLAITYLHAPARNISLARNACLAAATAPLLAFIDDDELATPGWLAALLARMEVTNADVVLGPVQALYSADAPAWLRLGDFHSTYPVETAGEIRTGYTCNVLFRRTAPAFAGLRFREELGRSGGEDSVFFAEAYAAGARLACAPAAIVTEPVTPARATVRWLLQRRFRAGQTHTLLATGRLDLFIKALAKMLFCYLRGLLTLISVLIPFGKNTEKKVTSLRWLLRGTLHLGVVCRILGKSKIEPYGQPHG